MWQTYLRPIVFSRLLLFFLTFPLLVIGSVLATTTFKNEISSWLPTGSVERESYEEHKRAFGAHEVIFITWPSCTIDNPVLADIETKLLKAESEKHFAFVTSGRSIDRQLSDSLKLSANGRQKRLSGYWVNEENDLTFMVAKLSETGISNREGSISHIYEVLEQSGINLHEIRLAGPSLNLAKIDYEGFWSPLRSIPFILVAVFLISWILLRQLHITIFVNLLSSYTATFSLALVYCSGVPLNSIVWPLPTLVTLLTTSAALHFLSYYRDALSTSGNELDAPKIAFRNAFKATVLCATTTSVGLFSLMTSGIGPVFQFGMFGGVSVLFSCFAVLFWLPAWLRISPYRTGVNIDQLQLGGKSVRWTTWTRNCDRWRKPILISLIAGMLLFATQLPNLRTGTSNEVLFPQHSQLIQDQNWIETNLAEINSTEVRIEFGNAEQSNDRNRLRWLLNLQIKLKDWNEFTGASSAGTYSPKPNKNRGLAGRIKNKAVEIELQELKSEFILAGLTSPKTPAGSESWLISLRGPSLGYEDTQQLMAKIHDFLQQEFAKVQERYFANEQLSVSTTGFSIINNHLEKRFLQDLAVTYSTAFVLMSLLFTAIFRSWKLLLVSIVPNLFPAVMVLGAVALLQVSLDVCSLMTASVALGIAVDDTLHFLIWWRSKSAKGFSANEAIGDALNYCGLAMLQTTVVFGVGLSLYAFCGFLPTMRFGLLLSGMMLFAIVGDLVLIPALLSTRLGCISSRNSLNAKNNQKPHFD